MLLRIHRIERLMHVKSVEAQRPFDGVVWYFGEETPAEGSPLLLNRGSKLRETKSFGKPWENLAIVGPIPKHLERAEAVAHFHLATGHDFLEVTSTGLAWLLTRPALSAAMPEWMRPAAPVHWTR
ncbi:hypothetical protein TNCV_4858041 [Trichonephila clavipes]|nr:hypothetical protein TNCV_4858041 [Trichonephila clavipes]